ncbi:ankyrin repeat domain-containing protein [Phytomonospora endophytica]|uniref:Ankyrin repeat protein n=1 Tax=Phytomonospora endophytica TaxID=714109 RepID=A0A841FMB0_9ACTN|nr:ankyrin repeat domain-containing protein [Phytomonospora endophytica]MBB6034337.1 ankyrin repeat protein [Phytomonospora endophytica]GIG66731.1 hypothetical protein Pen01_30260 [Phytomonospora endophytica]
MAAPHLSAAVLAELRRLKARPPIAVELADVKVETPLGTRVLPPSVLALAAVEWPAGHVVITKDSGEYALRLPETSEVDAEVFGEKRAWFAVARLEYGARWILDLDAAAGTDDPVIAREGKGFRNGPFWAKPLSERLAGLKSKRPLPKKYDFPRACATGDVEAVKAGIAAGAWLWPVKAGEPTPLHLAALASRSPEAVRLLIEAGAGLEVPLDQDAAALHRYGERERFRYLRLMAGDTPLAAALEGFSSPFPETVAAVPGIVRVLLAAGANPNARTGFGSPFGRVSHRHGEGIVDVVGQLLAAGADPDPADRWSPLLSAVKGSADVVRALLAAGADPCRGCAYGHLPGTRKPTPLHKAAGEGGVEILRLLIAAARDVDVLSADGVAPLHCAAAGDDPERVRLLLEAGAGREVRLPDPASFREGLTGRTPLEIARELGNDEHAAILAG